MAVPPAEGETPAMMGNPSLERGGCSRPPVLPGHTGALPSRVYTGDARGDSTCHPSCVLCNVVENVVLCSCKAPNPSRHPGLTSRSLRVLRET